MLAAGVGPGGVEPRIRASSLRGIRGDNLDLRCEPARAGRAPVPIRCRSGDVARYVLLPGDPTRVPLIAARWAEGREIAVEREHVTFTGTLRDGGAISACSTGAGGPSTASALEELIAIGADTFIRVGTCGRLLAHLAVPTDCRCHQLLRSRPPEYRRALSPPAKLKSPRTVRVAE